jgi:Imelysin
MKLGRLWSVAAAAAALFVAGCGDDDDESTTTAADATGSELAAIKGYLTEHSAELAAQTEILKQQAEHYFELAEAADFDYEQLLNENRAEVERILAAGQEAYRAANPAYEEMEGIVAGVPRLAQYDVDIDAGSDASDPENAVSFSLELPDGEVLKQPGNFMFLTETSWFATNEDFLADGVKGDVDGDGDVSFGEGLPDANFLVAAMRSFDQMADELDADAQEFEPTPSDAFTAITVMTPTMSEYFEAWKASRFVAGGGTSAEFAAASRLSDIADILEGIVFTYDEVEPQIAAESPQQADQTGTALNDLLAYVEDLRDREEQGEKFTAEQADTLGSEAQRQAEAIAGQVAQAAQRLGIELQEA